MSKPTKRKGKCSDCGESPTHGVRCEEHEMKERRRTARLQTRGDRIPTFADYERLMRERGDA